MDGIGCGKMSDWLNRSIRTSMPLAEHHPRYAQCSNLRSTVGGEQNCPVEARQEPSLQDLVLIQSCPARCRGDSAFYDRVEVEIQVNKANVIMEAIKASIAKHGNIWSLQTNKDMNELYEPLHAAQASQFKSSVTVEKGITYGTHARHRLDVYKPVAASSNKPLPVVVFFHGGGFTSGDNDITPFMHGNIGNYFASNGCVCFLGTYRLLPEARYPSGGEDTTAALKWVQDNASQYGGDSSKITAVGQSAGGAHLANAVFSGIMKKEGVKLKALVLLSPPMSYDLRQERRRNNMFTYHDTETEAGVMEKTAVSVFKNAKEEDLEGMNLLLMVAELDSNEIVDGNLAFVDEYRKRFRRLPLFEVMQGHNHISNTLEIGLPGSLVGRRIHEFATE